VKPSPNAVDQNDLISSDTAGGPSYSLHCERCGYNWNPTRGRIPLQCALCRSTYYTRPLTRIRGPEIKAEYQRKVRQTAENRRKREGTQARIKRLKRIATSLGKNSVGIVQDLFPAYNSPSEMVMRVQQRLIGMPPPPKFEDVE
jgi:hypothetical protein